MPHYSVSRDNSIRLALQLSHKPFTDTGGYETFGVTDGGGIVCWECVKANLDMHAKAFPFDGWMLDSIDCVCNHADEIMCGNCGRIINSASE